MLVDEAEKLNGHMQKITSEALLNQYTIRIMDLKGYRLQSYLF